MVAHKCTQERIISYLIKGVLVLFVLYAGIWVYASEMYATKDEVAKTEKRVGTLEQNIQQTMNKILDKVSK